MSWQFNDEGEPECPLCLVEPCWGRRTTSDGRRVWFQCRRCHMDFYVEESA